MKSLSRQKREQLAGAEAVPAAIASLWKGARFEFDLTRRTLVMGILNATPDSFSDGGRFNGVVSGLQRAWQIAEQGAHILDIGGESTRPGSEPVSVEDEIARTVPVIHELVQRDYPLPISIDTSKTEVAREALNAGAAIINDVSAMSADSMIELAAATGAGVALMHMRGTPASMQRDTAYDDLVAEVCDFLAHRAATCMRAGIPREAIALDPGIGFGKSVEGNLRITRGLDKLEDLGHPVLYGASRKSFIGLVLNVEVDQRLEGSLAAAAAAILCGADIVRVHDVEETVRTARMIDAILNPSSAVREEPA